MIRHSQPTINKSDFQILNRVLLSGYLSDGQYVSNLERALRDFIGTRFAIATNSGTSALHLVLLGLNISKGDEVIIPSYVCSSVLNAILYAGAEPVICDIEPDSYNLSFAAAKQKISKKVKAIILPYMFGGNTNIDKFLALDIPIIEDCAQSLGATYHGRRVGSFGVASVFSFYATKMITAGQGGMILTNSNTLYRNAKDLIEYDERDNYSLRYNYKMTDLQAALGLTQFKRIGTFIARRRKIARYYDKVFSKCDVIVPINDSGHIYYRYVVRIDASLKKFIRRLKKKGIETKPPVFKPLHRYLGLDKKLFPNTEDVFKTAASLPIYPSLTDDQMLSIARSVIEAL